MLDMMNACYSGTDYEELFTECLRSFQFTAKRTGKNDDGVDIIAQASVDNTIYTYYIQCKFQFATVGIRPIQEVFTGCMLRGNDGFPVVVTNNRVTYGARQRARKLGVEVIGDVEWRMLAEVERTNKNPYPNISGLLGLLIGAVTEDNALMQSSIRQSLANLNADDSTNQLSADNEEQEWISSTFDEAIEHEKEAARLEQQASRHRQKAIELQKMWFLGHL